MKLVFIGAINHGNPPRGGEEYKNQLLVKKIDQSFIQSKILDTYRWLKKPQVWWGLINNLFIQSREVVLISASSVSTYRLIKLMSLMRPSLMERTTYLVIGGYFPEGIRSKRFDWKYYGKLKNILVEGDLLRMTVLANSELSNVKVVPNFKTFPNLNFLSNEKLNHKFRFVFVGRISEGKGVKEILEAINILSQTNNDFEVHFYGPLEENFELERENSKYRGFLDFQNDPEITYSELSEYDCMLFPTYWKGEGFPGVIIDAFVAGLPVIATDWNMNTEIIEEGINGFVIEPKSSKALADKMKFVIENREELGKISQNNLACAKDYHIDKIWPQIMELL